MWELKGITVNEGQIIVSQTNYNGPWYKVTVKWEIRDTITDRLSIITLYDPFIRALYSNGNNMFLPVTSNLIIIFIGITLNQSLIKSRKVLINASFHKSKHPDFGSFHEYKH